MANAGIIVVLNGTPRSGKSTVARAIQDSSDGLWLNLGVDAFAGPITPEVIRPGIGVRPGGERPDLEEHLPVLFDALYGSVVACSRLGLNVVVDVGHHDDYSRPLGILQRVARRLGGSEAYFIGV
ncbi:MAG: phosphotransferase-like protein, partial [Acidimicrobiales bacterium]